MKKGIILILALFMALPAWAGTQDAIEKAKSQLKRDFPKMTVESVTQTPIKGVFEVVAGGELFYYAPESGHFLLGELLSKKGENLTQKTKERIIAKKINELPLESAVKIGNGPIKVIEITDPDCGFCRKGSAYLDTREADVTRYVFFYPLTKSHPKAAAKAKLILASADKAKALKEVMSGKYDSGEIPDPADNGMLAVHRKVAEKLKVTGTPAYWIDGTFVGGANIPALEKLLGKK